VRGTVWDSKGKPIAHVMVYRKMPNHFPSQTLLTRSRPDGTFELVGLPSGDNLLFARRGAVNVSMEVKLAAGQVLGWYPVLDLGRSLTGHLSVPIACTQQFRVECWGDNGGNVQTEYLDGSGEFAFYGLGSEPQVIEVIARLGFGTCYQRVVNPGDPPLKIELDCSLVPSIRIKGRLVWDKGKVADLRVVPIGPGYENSSLYNRTRPDGSFDIGKYRPGRWKVEVRKGDFNVTLLQSQVIEITANEIVDLGTLVIP